MALPRAHNFPSNGGVCNDMAVGSDGTVYATESFANRIHRLKPGAKELDLWVPADPQLAGVDGIAILADGAVYVNTFFAGQIFRIPVNPDGSAGALVPIELSMPLGRPDGLRTVGPRTMIQAEGQGRVTELTINGNRAEVRVVKDGLTGATGVTLVGDTAVVLVERARAVVVPYRRQCRPAPTLDTAGTFAQLGQLDAAFATLESMISARRVMVVQMDSEPRLDPLRSDPRFTELVRRVGLRHP